MTKNKQKKVIPLVPESPKKPKLPKVSINDLKPKWSFRRIDWSFSLEVLEADCCKHGQRLSSGEKAECCFHLISSKLKDYEGRTWEEIQQNDTSGCHFISLKGLKSKNLQVYNKFLQLAVNEGVEEPFTLRLNKSQRLWGIVLNDGTFEVLWWDPKHNGYPDRN